MARGDSLARQLQLWMLLERERSLSVEQICARLSINKRTLYRDFDVLQRVGIPLYQEPEGRRVRWRVADGFKRTLYIQLSLQEAIAFVAAERLLSAIGGTIFASAAKTAAEKVKAQLAEPIRQRLCNLTSTISATMGGRRDLKRHSAHLDSLLNALEHTRVVELGYQKLDARRPQSYTVEPHNVHVHGSSVYLIGWARERRAPRIFLLDRVRSVMVTEQSFTRRAELPIGVFEHGAFGLWEGKPAKVHLRFRGSAAQIISEQKLHPSQVTTVSPNDCLDLKMTVPISPALVAWVRGFKGRVEVLKPESLKNDL